MIDQAVPDTRSQASPGASVEEETDSASLRAELQAREAERQRLESEVSALSYELEEARQLLARLRPRLDAQQDALHRVYASLSWRVTRPIRGMGGVARRLRSGRGKRP